MAVSALLACSFTLLAYVSPCRAAEEILPPRDESITAGWTRAQVIEHLGPPQAQVARRSRETLYYGNDEVVLAHGVVIDFTPGIERTAQRLRNRPGPPSVNAQHPVPAPSPTASASPSAPAGEKVRTLSDKGRRVDLSSLLVPGKVTVIDFYADWCGPCRRLSPQVEAMVRGDPDLYLRKIDIVRWKTPVTQQFKLRYVPQLWVFDRDGKQVGQPTSKLAAAKEYVAQAKR